jgi:CheY-like chemotaxis protein
METTQTSDLRGRRFLVVDDDPATRLLTTAILDAAGAEVETARDGCEAVTRIRRAPFDLVLMDLNMPVMDGFSTAKKLQREFSNEQVKPRIAGISVTRTTDAKRRALAAGMIDLMPKPVNPTILSAFVKAMLDRDEVERATTRVAPTGS